MVKTIWDLHFDGFFEWDIVQFFWASEFGIWWRPPAVNGSEEEKEDDLQPRIGSPEPPQETEASGRPDGPGGSAQEGESPDSHRPQPHLAAVSQCWIGERHSKSSGRRVDPPASVIERNRELLEPGEWEQLPCRGAGLWDGWMGWVGDQFLELYSKPADHDDGGSSWYRVSVLIYSDFPLKLVFYRVLIN